MGDDHQVAKLALDAGVALPALTSPVWWDAFDAVTHVLLVLGGLFLLYLRIRIALDERKSRRGHRRRASDAGA